MRKYLYLLAFVLLCFSSCTPKTTKDIQKVVGQPLNIPTTLTAHIQKRDTTLSIQNNTPKLLVYYNFDGCSSCKLKELLIWNDRLAELDSIAPQCQPIFIMNVGTHEQKTRMDLLVYQFARPVLFDRKGDFESLNLLPDSQMLHTFLLDQNNKVVLVGSPVSNLGMWKLYKSTIQKMSANGGTLPQ